MNERIEKLMLDATKDMPQGYYVPGVYFEQFAELIVQECIGIVTDAVDHREPASNYTDRIKQHFEIK
jgi:hypothetical protein